MPHPVQLVSSLADADRLHLYALVASSGAEGLDSATLRGSANTKRLARLERDGLVRTEGSHVVAVTEVFAEAVREHKNETRTTDPVDALFHDGRLSSMPSKRKLRLATLERISTRLFSPGLVYTEKQVNAALRTCVDDHVALRRYLVEEGFLDREDDGSRYRLAASESPARAAGR